MRSENGWKNSEKSEQNKEEEINGRKGPGERAHANQNRKEKEKMKKKRKKRRKSIFGRRVGEKRINQRPLFV